MADSPEDALVTIGLAVSATAFVAFLPFVIVGPPAWWPTSWPAGLPVVLSVCMGVLAVGLRARSRGS